MVWKGCSLVAPMGHVKRGRVSRAGAGMAREAEVTAHHESAHCIAQGRAFMNDAKHFPRAALRAVDDACLHPAIVDRDAFRFRIDRESIKSGSHERARQPADGRRGAQRGKRRCGLKEATNVRLAVLVPRARLHASNKCRVRNALQ